MNRYLTTIPALSLSDRESAALRRALTCLEHAPDQDCPTVTLRAAMALPDRVLTALQHYLCNPHAPGSLLLRNMPLEQKLPATPTTAKTTASHSLLADLTLLVMAHHFGLPVGYADENAGATTVDVAPQPGRELHATAKGSMTELHWHVDDVAHPVCPDHVLLECLRGDRDRKAATCILEAREVLSRIPVELVTVLRKPLFQIKLPPSFAGEHWTAAMPLIVGSAFLPAIRANFNCMRGTTPEASHAIDAAAEYLNGSTVGCAHVMEPGDLLIVANNGKVLHRRTRFMPRYDGHDRWLKRVYVLSHATRWRHRDHFDPANHSRVRTAA